MSRRAVLLSLFAAACGGGSTQAPTVALTLTFAGQGKGAVVSVPAGLSCSATCSGNYPLGVGVQLTATPAAGSVFAGWSGGCTGIDLCNVTVAADLAVTAQFDLVKAATVPGAPGAVVATAQDQGATVTWTAPTGGGVTSYSIVASPGGASVTAAANATSATVTGLTNSTSYVFTVFALNQLGTGPGTTSAAVTPFGLPGAPLALSGEAGDTQATLTWTAADGNGSAIIGYRVTQSPGGAVTTVSSTSATVSGLTNGSTYSFAVTAVNGAGIGPAALISITPIALTGKPSAPAITSIAVQSQQLIVNWTAPASDGGAAILDYRVTISPGVTVNTVGAGVFSNTFSGLTNGTIYTITVAAENANGTGAATTASATPVTTPASPGTFTATPGDSSVQLSWSPPSDNGGSAITGYTVTRTPGTGSVSTTATTLPMTGLINGTSYSFTVAAVNALGAGTRAVTSATPFGVPAAPPNFTATPSNGSAALSWTAPVNGGSAITRYTVTTNPGGVQTSTTATSLPITGLTNGTAYTFSVVAVNAGGAGAASTATATPFGVASVPVSLTASPGDSQVVLSWAAPANNGGSAITGYTVTKNGASPVTVTATSFTATGLTNGTAVTFAVVANNAAGSGPAASISATPVASAGTPGAPLNVVATPGNAQVAVSWAAPASNGGSAITSYTITQSPGPVIASATPTQTTATFTGLTNGTQYTFTVTAVTRVGSGPATSATATPFTNPGVPTGFTAVAGNAQVTLSWSPPASTGGSAVTGYSVSQTPGTASTTSTSATAIVMTGLTNGTAYSFQVAAINAAGTGSAASAAATPASAPAAPVNFTATPGDSQIALAWTAPVNGGSPITSYAITRTPGSITTTTSSTSQVVTGLSNGTLYSFSISAVNAIGTGPASTASATPAVVPALPSNFVAAAGNLQLSLSWTAPANGGSAISSYSLTRSPGAFSTSTSGTSLAMTGLTNGTTYTVTVAASNAAGTGPVATTTGTPCTVPDPPTGFTAAPGNAQATLAWTAPVNNGGSAITGYKVTGNPGAISVSPAAGATGATVTALTNGTLYTFALVAISACGSSVAASASATPATVPNAPASISAVRGNGQVVLSWTAPASNGGSALTGYTVTQSPGAVSSQAATTTSITLPGTNGTLYTFTVSAINAVGTGAAASATATPATTPGVPSIASVTAGNSQVTVNWTAPASDGGSAIINYKVTSTPGGFTATSSTTSATVGGLDNGTSYTFTVHATNAVGASAESTASASATPVGPQTVPQAPTGISVTAGNTIAVVSWSTPPNGGSAITGYSVSSTPSSGTTSASSTSVTVRGLTNGTAYTFTVVANNAIGPSAPSATSSAVTPNAGAGTTFPLSVSANGRFLQDAKGLPFPIFGDSGWEAPHNLSAADQATYLSDRAGKGFTAVLTPAIEHKYTAVKPPHDLSGNLPFGKQLGSSVYTGSPNGCIQSGTNACGNAAQFAPDNYTSVNAQAPDFTTPVTAYWGVLDSYVSVAASHGMLVFIYPMYFGFGANDEGWNQEMVANDAVIGAGGFAGQPFADATKSKLWNYGAWLADHYKASGNIVWILGGDSGVNGVSSSGTFTAAQSNAVLHVYQGMHSVAGQQSTIWTGHWGRGALATDISSDATNGAALAAAMTLQSTYPNAAAAQFQRVGYAHAPVMPVFDIEDEYEGDTNAAPEPNRRYHYWEMLSSSEGYFWSAGNSSSGSIAFWGFPAGWPTLLQSQGSQDNARLNGFFTSIPWWTLVPSGLNGMRNLVTAGGGTASPQSTDYVAAAADAAGTLLLAYVPPAHAGTITVDLSVLSKTARLRWFNPFDATFTAVSTNTTNASLTLTPPGSNGSGFSDWVLVADTP